MLWVGFQAGRIVPQNNRTWLSQWQPKAPPPPKKKVTTIASNIFAEYLGFGRGIGVGGRGIGVRGRPWGRGSGLVRARGILGPEISLGFSCDITWVERMCVCLVWRKKEIY